MIIVTIDVETLSDYCRDTLFLHCVCLTVTIDLFVTI